VTDYPTRGCCGSKISERHRDDCTSRPGLTGDVLAPILQPGFPTLNPEQAKNFVEALRGPDVLGPEEDAVVIPLRRGFSPAKVQALFEQIARLALTTCEDVECLTLEFVAGLQTVIDLLEQARRDALGMIEEGKKLEHGPRTCSVCGGIGCPEGEVCLVVRGAVSPDRVFGRPTLAESIPGCLGTVEGEPCVLVLDHDGDCMNMDQFTENF